MNAPAPGSPEWARVMTASKVAAVLGVSPYESPRSLWHKMRGDVAEPQRESTAMSRGQYLEAGVLDWWHDRHPEFELEAQHYATRPDLPWAAATLDALAWGETSAVVEVKTTSRLDEWGDPGTDVIPTHYLTQVYWQLAMVPEAARAYVAVLGPFLDFYEYVVERDEDIQADLIDRCRRFYESLSSDTPPDLDDHVATFEVLRQQRGTVEKGATVDIDHDLAVQFLNARAAEDAAVSRARLWDSRVMEAVGAAQYITSGGVRIARQQDNRRRPVVVATPAAIEGAA